MSSTEGGSSTQTGALGAAAATDANLMLAILDCARARVSEGEMVAALQQVFGNYTELPVF